MELNEAGRRILGQHWRLIVLALALGLGMGALLHRGDVRTYTASTRLALDTPDPATRQESAAIADAAKAIATSPAQVRGALSKAHAGSRDPVEVAKHHVTVKALGTSAILQLSVSDRSPRAAAAISNALAAGLIRTRLDVGKGGVEEVLVGLDKRIAKLNQRILSSNINSRAGGDRAARLHDSLVERRGILESERDSLLSTDAVRPKPSVISPASKPDKADSSRVLADMILGGILALVFGVGLAGLLETIRPTLVGGDALGKELDTSLLGTLSGEPDAETTLGDASRIALRLKLAAEAAGVRNVSLLAAGPQVDLRGLAERLNGVRAQAEPVPAGVLEASLGWENAGAESGARPDFWIRPFDPEKASLTNGGASLLVLVTPEALKKTELVDTRHFLRVTHLPLLGLITYKPSRLKRLGFRWLWTDGARVESRP